MAHRPISPLTDQGRCLKHSTEIIRALRVKQRKAAIAGSLSRGGSLGKAWIGLAHLCSYTVRLASIWESLCRARARLDWPFDSTRYRNKPFADFSRRIRWY